jgi:hypothetical protein
LAQALSHAQQVTRQALGDCERLHGDLVHQQQAATDAGTRASSLEQDASRPMMHPAAIAELNHQASLARGEQGTAQLAANQTQTLLGAAQRRGQDACSHYQTESQALTTQIHSAAGDLRPVDQMAGRAAASLLGAGGGTSMGAGPPVAAIANPLTSLPIAPFESGSILDAIEEARYRKWVLDAVEGTTSGGAAYSSEQGWLVRQQLTGNARRLIQLDDDIATVGFDTPDGAILNAIRTAVASESSTISSSANALAGRASFLENGVAPWLLGIGFASNIASGKDLTQAATSSVFSFSTAWMGMQAADELCPKTPVSLAVCTVAGSLAGGFGGEVVADKLARAEAAVNRELKRDWTTLSTPIGGGGLLSGVTPLMGGGAP